MDKIISYTAANALPFKIFRNEELLNSLKKGRIIPIHTQINPTNLCNQNCEFCSCKNRDKNLSLSRELMTDLLYNLYLLGCQAITITGGGEPLLYSHINELISYSYVLNIKIGLVTTGYDFHLLNPKNLNKITWCRISCSDESYLIDFETEKKPNVDWAFSYVVTEKFDIDNLCNYILYANKHKFTHIRVVSDLLNLDKIISMDEIKEQLKKRDIDDSLVIYQGRKQYVRGQKNCYISLLKPVIGADGKLYPCCGVQYALEKPSLDYEKSMYMGDISELEEIYDEQKFFDGSNCVRCYYDNYNLVLDKLLTELDHCEFV